MTAFVFFMLKSLVFLLLSVSLLFEFLLSHTSTTPLSPTYLFPPPCVRVCCLSMPPRRQRESLESVKARLVREQKVRTDRRVRELLQHRQTLEDSDDSEEENRLIQRSVRREHKNQATQTDSTSLSFCCGVVVGVFVVILLLFCLIGVIGNDRQRMAR